jgi:hypothetical protein
MNISEILVIGIFFIIIVYLKVLSLKFYISVALIVLIIVFIKFIISYIFPNAEWSQRPTNKCDDITGTGMPSGHMTCMARPS